jgi:hypothetical protein
MGRRWSRTAQIPGNNYYNNKAWHVKSFPIHGRSQVINLCIYIYIYCVITGITTGAQLTDAL